MTSNGMKPLIKKLVDSYGPSGHEAQTRDLIRAEIKGLADYTTVDPLGNLIAVFRKKAKAGRKVMLAAHMDEIGVIATHIDAKGFVRVLPVGGVSPLTCIGGRVRFANGAVGVIGIEKRDNTTVVPSFEQLFVDVGATSADTCPIKVGDAAGFYRPFRGAPRRIVHHPGGRSGRPHAAAGRARLCGARRLSPAGGALVGSAQVPPGA